MRHIPGKDHTQIPGNYNTTYPSYVSGVIDFGPNDERKKAVEMQFGASVGVSDSVNCLTGSDDASSSDYYKAEFIKKGLGQHIDTGWTGGFAASGGPRAKSVSSGAALAPNEVSISFGESRTKANVERSVPNKYVEVQGPNGSMRLSPEVAARNNAAAEDYSRKMEEHARAKAEHERKLALHQQSQVNAAAEKRAYEQKLAMNEAEVAAHTAAMDQYKTATTAPAKGAKGWMYCDARGAVGDKRRFYSRVTEVDYVPGSITIIDVMAKNRPAFKSYVAGAHSIFFATDSLLHCPYSTSSLADSEALMARDKRGDGNNGIEVIQTGWVPAS